MFSNAKRKSSIRSSAFSNPIDNLICCGVIPVYCNSSGLNCPCVVDAGWIAKLFASATFAKFEKISKLSITLRAASSPPTTSNEKIDPLPLGRYFLANS